MIAALHLFLNPQLKDLLQPVQLMARLIAVRWFQEEKVRASVMETFEDRLYRFYGSGN